MKKAIKKATVKAATAEPLITPFRISVEQAVNRIKKWKDHEWVEKNDTSKSLDTKAFFITISDMTAMIEEITALALPVAGVRAYLATRTDPVTQENVNELLFVPVVVGFDNVSNNAEEDATIGLYDYYTTDQADPFFFGVYDFTTPCPNMCDKTSVLYSTSEAPKTKLALKDIVKEKLITKKRQPKK